MTDRLSLFIGDLFRWLLALIILPFIPGLIFLFFNYPFDWLLSISTRWSFFLHMFFWAFIGITLMYVFIGFGNLLGILSTYVVRQNRTFIFLIEVQLWLLIGSAIIDIWSGSALYSWEELRYPVFNKILFSLLILQLVQIPNLMKVFTNEIEQKVNFWIVAGVVLFYISIGFVAALKNQNSVPYQIENTEQNVSELIKEFKQLYKEGRFHEANDVLFQIEYLSPDSNFATSARKALNKRLKRIEQEQTI